MADIPPELWADILERMRQVVREVVSAELARLRPTPSQVIAEDRTAALVDIRHVAKLLSLSQRTVWRMGNDGSMPAPVRLGASVRWVLAEIDDWTKAGCPPVQRPGDHSSAKRSKHVSE